MQEKLAKYRVNLTHTRTMEILLECSWLLTQEEVEQAAYEKWNLREDDSQYPPLEETYTFHTERVDE